MKEVKTIPTYSVTVIIRPSRSEASVGNSFVAPFLLSSFPEKLFDLPCEWNYRSIICLQVTKIASQKQTALLDLSLWTNFLKIRYKIPLCRVLTSVPQLRIMEHLCFTELLTLLLMYVQHGLQLVGS